MDDTRACRSRIWTLSVAALLFATSAIAYPQESFVPAVLDFTQATIHQAGPSEFYVRGVGVGADSYSLLLEQARDGVWSVTRIVPEQANILPPQAILDFATISSPDGSTIRIDGVLVDGTVYGGALAVTGAGDLELVEQITVVGSDAIHEMRAAGLQAIIESETRAEFEQTLADLREELESVRADRDRLERELAAASDPAPGDPSIETISPLRGDQVRALIRERDELAGDVVGLVMENNELRAERSALREQLDGLQLRNVELRDDIEVMEVEIDRLQELLDVATRPAAAPEWRFPGDYVRRSDLRAAAELVVDEIRSLERRVETLERAAANLSRLERALERPSVATEEEARDALARAEQAERLARLQAELAELLAENEALRLEKQELESRVLDEILDHGFVAMMRDRLTRRISTGFADGTPDTGTWTVRPGAAVQTDPDAYFAKLAMPLLQSDDPVLYSVRVRALDPGWAGVGLHLFVDDVQRRRGYGMGSSLLVWLTRDPGVRRTDATFLQLYRSDDDVMMGRVLDAAVPHAIDEFLDLDILYEPRSQYVTVALDGVDRVRYRAWFGIDAGVEIALRSLGRAEFHDFSARTLPVSPVAAPGGTAR